MFNRLINKVFHLHREVKESSSFKVFCVDHLGFIEDPFYLESFYNLIRKHNLDDSFSIRGHFLLPDVDSLGDVFKSITLAGFDHNKGFFLSISDAGFHTKKERQWPLVNPSNYFVHSFIHFIGPMDLIRGFDLIKMDGHYLVLARLNFNFIDAYRKPVAIVSDISMLTNLKEVRSHELFNK